MQLDGHVAGVGQRPGLAQARGLGGRLGPGVSVRTRRGTRTAVVAAADRGSAVAAVWQARVVVIRCGHREQHGTGHDKKHQGVPEVLHKSGQVVRGPDDGRVRRRAQRQTERRVPGCDQTVAAAQLKDYLYYNTLALLIRLYTHTHTPSTLSYNNNTPPPVCVC